MDRITELAHALGEEIAKSDEIKALELAKERYETNAPLQEKLSKYEAQRRLLGEEFSKNPDEVDRDLAEKLKASIEELTREITSDEVYIAFAEAQNALNTLMAGVNEEIKFCITGERPAKCTHDCSTCSGCH
jgi:cell fate (sporulation/competence/biofilm development) regulator YlbF (YheA/YmcA/DUF963 family)